MVEFAASALTLFTIFFGFTQVAAIQSANLVLKHSAMVAARAAAVITNSTGTINPSPQGSQSGDPAGEVQQAAIAALGKYAQKGRYQNVRVDINDQSNESDPYGMICVTVNADYRCGVPLGGRLVCGLKGRSSQKAMACHAHQGARYKPESN